MDEPGLHVPQEQGDAPGDLGNVPHGMKIRNTFLQFEDDEDPWLIAGGAGLPRRQHTDSILERSGGHNRAAMLQSLGIQDDPAGPLYIPPFRSVDSFGAQARCEDSYGAVAADRLERVEAMRTLNADERHFGYPGDGHGHEGVPMPPPSFLLAGKPGAGRGQNAANQDEPEPAPTERYNVNGVAQGKILAQDRPAITEDDDDDEASEDNPDRPVKMLDAAAQAAKNMRDIAAQGGGLSNCTSVMIRHIPCKYTQRKLLREIDGAGFSGNYDFFYLPMDPRSHSNRGFAFLNFVTSEIAYEFYRMFHSMKLKHFNSDKVIAVMPADLQGFEANAEHYTVSRTLRRKRVAHSKPLFFRPLPDHLTVDDSIEVVLDTPITSGGPASAERDYAFCAAAADNWTAAASSGVNYSRAVVDAANARIVQENQQQTAHHRERWPDHPSIQHMRDMQSVDNGNWPGNSRYQGNVPARTTNSHSLEQVAANWSNPGLGQDTTDFRSALAQAGLGWAMQGPAGPSQMGEINTQVKSRLQQNQSVPQAQMQFEKFLAPVPQAMVGGDSLIPRFCGFCGNPRRPDHTFCPYCGAKFQRP